MGNIKAKKHFQATLLDSYFNGSVMLPIFVKINLWSHVFFFSATITKTGESVKTLKRYQFIFQIISFPFWAWPKTKIKIFEKIKWGLLLNEFRYI